MASIVKFEVAEDLVTARTHSRIMREVGRAAMQHHRNVRLGKHYKDAPETAPGGAYGYERRSARYQKRKQEKKGHNLPLVWSGRTRNYVRNNARITATQHRVRMTARNYFPLTTQRRTEIEAISAAEQTEIAKGMRESYYTEATKPENRRQRRTRS